VAATLRKDSGLKVDLVDGKTRPLLVFGLNDSDRTKLVLKLRHPESPVGHFGPSSLARELICAVLARRLGLPVPDYAIVRAAVAQPLLKNSVLATMFSSIASKAKPLLSQF
jgi:hypothetical protein